MQLLEQIIDLFLHLDTHLASVIEAFGPYTYVILFLIIFAETGLVITPFLPGDSLIFAAGTFAALGVLDPYLLFVLLAAAAIIGDTVNYAVGAYLGPRVFRENVRFLRRDYLMRAEAFYEKHGGKTIILARFIPIIRTFAPFVAGIGSMTYGRFIAYNVVGGLVWVGLFVFSGYLFGNVPWVKENFETVILAIIAVSLIPPVWEWLKSRSHKDIAT
jgi:membrane-associated protein